jgi:hypothetical protein
MSEKDNLMPPDVWVMHNQVAEANKKMAILRGFIIGNMPNLPPVFQTQGRGILEETK